jgi:type III pantothenate kinase
VESAAGRSVSFSLFSFARSMLLAIDIGNTSAKFGLYDGALLRNKFVIPTNRDMDVRTLVKAVDGRLGEPIESAWISSVVPEVDDVFRAFLAGMISSPARFITPADDFGLTFNYPTEEKGSDRLINSFAAAEKYGTPCILIAFGTATTIDVINGSREHLGGLIAPGPATAAKALEIATSKLPEVQLVQPANVLGTSTVSSIQSGIFYGQIGLVETAVAHILSEIGGQAKVIATGGFAHLIADLCKSIDRVDSDLTLDGLRMLSERLQPITVK